MKYIIYVMFTEHNLPQAQLHVLKVHQNQAVAEISR